MWEQTGKKPRELEELPEKPKELGYIYDLFCDLPFVDFSFVELKAWCELTDTRLTAKEVQMIGELNTVFVKAQR